MSETIKEMVLPGTYIEVRAEGLIGVGGISTGNIGVVGTASRGPVNEVQLLGSYAEALETFGPPEAWPTNAGDVPNALSLTRTLEQLFRGGASTVYAVRVSSTDAMATMSWDINSLSDANLFSIKATSPGSWANDIEVSITQDPAADEPITLTLEYGRAKEEFSGMNAGELASAIAQGNSRLVEVTPPAEADEDKRPRKVEASGTPGGPDGGDASPNDVADGLGKLERENVQIVVVGGRDAKTVAGQVLSHLESSENEGNERIAVLGASSDEPATIVSDDVSKGSSPRLVLVAPGLKATDPVSDRSIDLPAPYAAALVAGKLSTLAPHVSLTNKTVPASGLTADYTRAQQKHLLQNRVLVLRPHLGTRVLKGISTDTGAFKQISVRRIVDFAKAGTRIGANPYIGKLNNARVRAALKATLDGFLSGMVLDEMLTGYELDVTATRAQEIRGEAIVTMTLQPTFSIDFIKVIMNLQ